MMVLGIYIYIKKSPGKRLSFKKNENLKIEAYSDADYFGSKTYSQSTSELLDIYVRENLVISRIKRQTTVARSTGWLVS